MTVGELMESYEVCISSLRKSQGVRRTVSLKRIAPVNFSKEVGVQSLFLGNYELKFVVSMLSVSFRYLLELP